MSNAVDLAEIPAPALRLARPALPRVLYALVLDPGKKYGSMEEQIVLLADAFREQGSLLVPLFICADEDADAEQFRRRGIEAHCLELRRFHWATFWRLWRLICRHRIGAVHWNFTAPLANSYVWALTLFAPWVRHALTDHNSRTFPELAPPAGWRRVVKKLLLKRYRQVWGVSQYVRGCLVTQGIWPGLVCSRHFINTDRFRPDAVMRAKTRAEMRAELQFVLLSVGQLIPEKGMEVAIRALVELPAHVVLWIAGAGHAEARLRELIDELRLDERVRLLGLQRNVQTFMQAADAFVCPSLWGEAAGLVNLEAQACGLPIVASRIGGIPEYVEDRRSGILFEPGNHHEMAAAIRCLRDDPALLARMGREARAVAKERFAPEVRLPDILDIYRSL